MVNACKYCDNEFASAASMKQHQKTARYCLEKQNKKNKTFICVDCNSTFTTKHRLQTHQEICVDYVKNRTIAQYEEKLKDYESRLEEKNIVIRELQDRIQQIAIQAVKQPKSVTTNNNTTNSQQVNNIIAHLKPIESNHFAEQAAFLTIEHVKKGLPGYVEYAQDHPFKDRITCVDYARRKIKFKDEEGNIVTDPEMAKLAPKFFEAIKDKSKELTLSWGNEMKDQIGEEIFNRVIEALDIHQDIEKGSEGKLSDFYHDFVKYICSNNIADS